MANGIHILLKRAKNYLIPGTEPVQYIDKVALYILEYGEPLYLKDIGYLVIGDGLHTVKDLIEVYHRFFCLADNTSLYNFAQYVKDIEEYTANNYEITNIGYIKNILSDVFDDLVSQFKGSPSKTATAISYNPTTSPKFNVTFEDIKIDASKPGIIENLEQVIKETKVDNATHADAADMIKVSDANDSATTYYILGSQNAGDSCNIYRANAYDQPIGKDNKLGIRFSGSTGVLYGAAWNDIAEYKLGTGLPGECVCEDLNGNCKPSTKRLQKNPNIVSDTFGFIIGDSSDGNIPLAIAGRALAKPDKNRDKFKIGDVVCSGKNGTVSKMSRLEIILFPDRILGIVCKIPVSDTWNNVEIKNRLWIKIK